MQIYSWHKHHSVQGEKVIQELILSGEGVDLRGLPDYLAQTLNIPVHRAEVWRNALQSEANLPPISRSDSYGYAGAIGLALSGFIKTTL